ncbi:hypothetical protein AKJ47_01720 [candidate division MSBL1 archaeon SCGC-AAA261G05]|uniref:Uncharacterized protein n=1 Tax=candidate division MSBL1 archaeon SCGC-AAA261G05 TaxID=1698276 RepID=A0A133VB91_9EURY|nr:hypothetical protein AKJ47_01720 [candidate division MSBL1 archaeon SCGC-AAA261G05]
MSRNANVYPERLENGAIGLLHVAPSADGVARLKLVRNSTTTVRLGNEWMMTLRLSMMRTKPQHRDAMKMKREDEKQINTTQVRALGEMNGLFFFDETYLSVFVPSL